MGTIYFAKAQKSTDLANSTTPVSEERSSTVTTQSWLWILVIVVVIIFLFKCCGWFAEQNRDTGDTNTPPSRSLSTVAIVDAEVPQPVTYQYAGAPEDMSFNEYLAYLEEQQPPPYGSLPPPPPEYEEDPPPPYSSLETSTTGCEMSLQNDLQVSIIRIQNCTEESSIS